MRSFRPQDKFQWRRRNRKRSPDQSSQHSSHGILFELRLTEAGGSREVLRGSAGVNAGERRAVHTVLAVRTGSARSVSRRRAAIAVVVARRAGATSRIEVARAGATPITERGCRHTSGAATIGGACARCAEIVASRADRGHWIKEVS